ncbi:hypothetical protein ACJMK2_013161 [Sinanodonta woodiana]|uniref:Caspase-8 n=1 Tax=Sinanodonta woodiana TaxID=1069815 RepID=A0ABD3UWL6_SINWO
MTADMEVNKMPCNRTASDAVRISNKDGFTARLMNLSDNLGKKEIEGIKFLCRDFNQGSRLENCRKGKEIFQCLIETGLITDENIDIVVECLSRINRPDLIRMLRLKPDVVKQKVSKETELKPFRVMLFNLAEDISDEDVSKIRFYLQNFVPGQQNHNISRCTTMLDAFTLCEKNGHLGERNFEIIYDMLKYIKRDDLLDKVDEYAESTGFIHSLDTLSGSHVHRLQNSQTYEPMNISVSSPRLEPINTCEVSPSYQSGFIVAPLRFDVFSEFSFLPSSSYEFYTTRANNNSHTSQNLHEEFGDETCCIFGPELAGTRAETGFLSLREATTVVTEKKAAAEAEFVREFSKAVHHSLSPAVPYGGAIRQSQEQPESLNCYKMDAVPRGICLIINNKNFYKVDNDEDSVELEYREGTDIDCEKLQNLFSKLHFIVEVRLDQTDHEIYQLMSFMSKKIDHSGFDCFVCCVLSHGSEGNVFGTNGIEVPIINLTGFFLSTNCPSLAGKPKVFFIQACQGSEKQSGYKVEQDGADIVTDAPTGKVIPNEADFLLGFATVAGYASFRNTVTGTWYISKLVQMLERYHEREDVLSILVRVNREVCEENAEDDSRVYKQTPAPTLTLTRKLYL